MGITSNKDLRKKAKDTEKRLQGFVDSTPQGRTKKKKGTALSKYQGVTVKGKKYRTFAEIPVTPAGKKTTKQKLVGGIKLAIL